MLNYEDLYNQLQPAEKALKDSASAAVRLQKAIVKDTESGNLVNMKKNLEALKLAAEKLNESLAEVAGIADAFDTREYFAQGDFTRQLLAVCEDQEIDVKGERGTYEMFPYKVRIVGDEEHDGEVYINRKKLPSVRPSYVARHVKDGQTRLFKANFNAMTFMNEIAEAYETTCLKSGARIGSTQRLDKVYKAMAPMSRARKDYDKLAFAFDLARIYEAGPENWVRKDGRRYYFGSSRDGKTGYRVLSSTGVEDFVYTIKQLNEEE